ncbi:MAG TPA: hypothetical protein VMT19_02895 [Thermoanaerobaculaceae bacterium]|nr:hypothetical protein [Thermoanaerobaculaceae bacterium]
MIVLRLRRSDTPAPAAWSAFRVAGHEIVTDVPLAALAAFAGPLPADVPALPEPAPPKAAATLADETYRGPAWLCGSTREVVCSVTTCGYELTVAGVGEFSVAADGSCVDCTASALDPADPALAEAVLGPALTLALALRGTFCLHASAVLSTAGVLLFLGPSGSGKSTVAAGIAGGDPRFTCLTDDVTPLAPSADGVEVRPRFPQLKLPDERQPASNAPHAVALRAAYLLGVPDAASSRAVSVEALDPARGLAALVRHTVAVRLFSRDLLAAYLEALAAAPALPVRVLRYPRRHEVLPEVAAALAADVADHQ